MTASEAVARTSGSLSVRITLPTRSIAFLLLAGCGGNSSSHLVSISVTPAAASITSGTLPAFKAIGTYSHSAAVDLTNQVTWSTGATSVATVSNSQGSKGQAIAQGAGTTSVTASMGNVTGIAQLTVTAAHAYFYLSSNTAGAYQVWQWAQNADGSLTPLATPDVTVSALPT